MSHSFNSGSLINFNLGVGPSLILVISTEPSKLYYEWRGHDFLGLALSYPSPLYRNYCYTMDQLILPIKCNSLIAKIDNNIALEIAALNLKNKIWFFGSNAHVKNTIIKTVKSHCQIKNQANLFQFSNKLPLIASDMRL